jgi:Flp pilus assembly protein TadG
MTPGDNQVREAPARREGTPTLIMEEEGNMILRWRNFVQETQGTVIVLTAIALAVFLGFCGLAIDVGHYMVVKNELQNAADAGALAGVRALFPADMTTAPKPFIPDCTTAVNVASTAVHWNKTDQATSVVVGLPQPGHWDPVNRTFTPGCSSDPATITNAVQVTTHREDTPLFLMQVLGAVPKTIQASSIAAIFPPGGLKGAFPVDISQQYVQFGGEIRIFLNSDTNPDPSIPFDPINNPGDVGSWFLPGTSSSDFLGKISQVIDGTIEMPLLHMGDSIYMNNGVTTNLVKLVDNLKVGDLVWLPVVDRVKYNQTDTILGFTGFRITSTGQVKGKHYIQGIPTVEAAAPGDIVDDSVGTDYGLQGPARLVF